MGSKITAALAAAVVLFLVGFLLYEVVLGGFFEANTGSATGVIKETPSFLWLAVGQIAGGVLLVCVLGWAGVSDLAGGAKTGALLGFLVAASLGFTNLGALNINNLTATIADLFVQAVLLGAAGAVAGLMLGRGGQT